MFFSFFLSFFLSSPLKGERPTMRAEKGIKGYYILILGKR